MNTTAKYEFIDHRIQKLEVSNELMNPINKGGEIPPIIKLGYSVTKPREVETNPNVIQNIGNVVLSIECIAADKEQKLLKVNARTEGVFCATTDDYDENEFLQFLNTHGITELYVYTVGFLSGLIPQLGKFCSFSFPFLSGKNFSGMKAHSSDQRNDFNKAN